MRPASDMQTARWIEAPLWIAWTIVAASAAIATLVYPFAKGVPLGIVPALLGLGAAVVPLLFRVGSARLGSLIFDAPPKKWIVSLCLISAAVRVPLVLFPPPPLSDLLSYRESAVALAHGVGRLGVYYPPGQPAWLALWVAVFGDHLRILTLAQSLLALATIPVLYLALRPMNERGARLACLAVAFWPSLLLWSGTLGHETIQIFLLSVLLLVYRKAAGASGKLSLLPWVALGAVTAVISLVRPTYLAIVPVVLLAEFLRGRSIARLAIPAAIMVLSMCFVIAPWSIRNYRIYDRFCLISANAGINLLAVTHPDSNGIFYDAGDTGKGLNDVDRDHYHMQLAIASMKADPWRIVGFAFKKITWMWGSDTSMMDLVVGLPYRGTERIKQLLQAITNTFWAWFVGVWLVGAIVSRPWATHHDDVENVACLWVLLLFFLHALFEPQSRHHMPVIPLILAMSGPAYLARVNSLRAPRAFVQPGIANIG